MRPRAGVVALVLVATVGVTNGCNALRSQVDSVTGGEPEVTPAEIEAAVLEALPAGRGVTVESRLDGLTQRLSARIDWPDGEPVEAVELRTLASTVCGVMEGYDYAVLSFSVTDVGYVDLDAAGAEAFPDDPELVDGRELTVWTADCEGSVGF